MENDSTPSGVAEFRRHRRHNDMDTNGTSVIEGDHVRVEELFKALDQRKAGTKGLVDAGIQSVPKIFVRPLDELLEIGPIPGTAKPQIPIIDLGQLELADNRERVVNEIRFAAEKWGFFIVVNHGVPLEVLDKTLEDIRKFNEQDFEVKKELYTSNRNRVVYTGEYDKNSTKAIDWRDSLTINKAQIDHLDPQLIPSICKDAIVNHNKHILNLGNIILELLSLALGLKPNALEEMECGKGWVCRYHYYPPCPQPELALGFRHHTDSSFLTILLQDHFGGLQVLYENQWVDVNPIPGSLIVNLGDIFQIICNDKFKSVCHRVKSNRDGPRTSAAFFFTGLVTSPKIYGPIKGLVSNEDPPIYREFTIREFVTNFFTRPIDEPGYKHFMIKNDEEST